MTWKFACHGELSAHREENILIIEGTGPWNIEALHAAGKEIEQELDYLYQRPWAVLSIMHGQAAYLPDAVADLKEQIRQEKQGSRVATALVLTESATRNFTKGHLSQIYNDAGEHFEFFDDRETAMQWLNQQLQQVSSQS